MKLITGDETGLIKVSGIEKKELLGKMGTQTRTEGIECMEWLPGSEGIVVVGKSNGVVQRWDAYNQTLQASWQPMTAAHEQPRSVLCLQPSSAPLLITCCENGAVAIRSMDETFTNVTSEEDVTVAGPVSRMRGSPSQGKVAYGGKENELQLFDLETRKVEWKAKNVPKNKLDLRLPVWVTDLQFIDKSDDRKIAISTAYGQVRLYDVRAQRRPVVDAVICELSEQIRLADGNRLTSMAVHSDQTWAAVGDALGGLTKVDLRTGNVFGKFRHIAGSVRAVQFHPSEPFIAAASLDRFVRVYEHRSMKMISQVYLKQKLTALLFDPEASTAPPGAKSHENRKRAKTGEAGGDREGDDDDDDDDQTWDAMNRLEQDEEGGSSDKDAGAEEEEAKTGDDGRSISRKGMVMKKRKTEKRATSVKAKKGAAAKKKKK